MLVNDELYFQTFCELLEAVVKAGGLETSVEHLQKNHFYLLSRKINLKANLEHGLQPTTLRDYRYIYKRKKKFSIRQNRLDLMCEFLGYDGWNEYKQKHFQSTEINQSKSSNIRVLVLPDKRVGVVNTFEGQIADLITSRYEALQYDLGIDNLEIIVEDHLESTPNGLKNIHELGVKRQANMVIWPEYLHGKNPMMRVPALPIVAENQPLKCVRQRYQKVGNLVDIMEGTFLEEADIMLFSLLGTAAFEKGEQDKALSYFEKVLTLDPENADAEDYVSLIKRQDTAFQNKSLSNDVREEEDLAGLAQRIALLPPEENEMYSTDSSPNTLVSDGRSSLKKYLLVLNGDKQVLKSKDLEPLVRSTLIHEDEPIIFLTTHTGLSLMSMNDLSIFRVQAERKQIPLKETLVSIDRQLKRKNRTDGQSQLFKWLFISSQDPGSDFRTVT